MTTAQIAWSDPATEAHLLASEAAGRKGSILIHKAAHAESERGRPLIAHVARIESELHTAKVKLAEGFRDVATPDTMQVLAMDVLGAERQAEALRLFTGLQGMTLRGGLNSRPAMDELDHLLASEPLFTSRWALAELSAFRRDGVEPQLPIDELSAIARAARQELVDDAA